MNRGTRAVLLVAAIAATLAIHLKSKQLEGPELNTMIASSRDRADASPLVGRPAPDFSLNDLAGKPLLLADHRGETVVLNFFATWCGPCRAEMPDLNQFAADGRAHGIRVVGIDVQEPAADVRAFVAAMGLTFPVLLDESGSVSAAFGVEAFPTTLLIAPSGVVLDVRIGMIEDFDAWYNEASRMTSTTPDRT